MNWLMEKLGSGNRQGLVGGGDAPYMQRRIREPLTQVGGGESVKVLQTQFRRSVKG